MAIKDEDQFNVLFENTPEPILIIDAQSKKIIKFNKRCVDFFKLTEEELLGKGPEELSPDRIFGKETTGLARKYLAEAIEGKNPVFEWIHLDKEGNSSHCEIRLVRFPPYEQKLVRASIIDISDQVLLKARLEESEERLQKVLKATDQGTFDWYPIEDNLFWDDQLHIMFGLSVKSKKNRNKYFFSILHPDDLERVESSFMSALAPGATQEKILDEYRVVVNGKIRYIETSGSISRNEKGETVRLIGTCRDVTQARRMEQQVKNAHEYAENLIETANSMVVGLDLQGKVTIFNEAAERISGYTKADILGKDCFEVLVPKKKYPTVWDKFGHLDKGFPKKFENPILTKSGEERLISWQNSEVKESGKTVGMISFGMDVTEPKRAEKKLKKSELKYRSILEQASDGIFITDPQGRYIEVNPAGCISSGYTREEILGSDISLLISPEELAKNPLRLKELSDKKTLITEREMLRKDGTKIPVELSSKMLENGWFQSIVRDISLRKEAENHLRESEEKYRALVQHVPIVSWTSDEQGNMVFVSENVKDIYGLSAEEIIKDDGRVRRSRIHEDDVENVAKAFDNFVKGKTAKYDVEYRIRNKDDEWIWISVQANSIKEQQGKKLIYGVFSDISERKKNEQIIMSISNRLALATHAARFGTWQWDIPKNELIWDDILYAIYNIEKTGEPIQYETWRDAMHPEDREATEDQVQKALEGELDFNTTFRIVWPDGTIRYVEGHAIVSRDTSGHAIKMTGVNLDVTDKVDAQIKLKQSEESFRSMVQDQTEMIVRWYGDGIRTFVNDAYCNYFQISREEAIGTSFFPLTDKEELKENRKRIEKLTPEQPIMSGEYKLKFPNGKVAWQEWTDRAFFDDQNQLKEYQSVGRDVTEQKMAREAVREAREKFETIFAKSPLGILYYDSKGGIQNLNEAALEVFDVEPTFFNESFNLFDSPGMTSQLAKKLKKGGSVHYETTFVNLIKRRSHASGHKRHLDVVISCLYEAGSSKPSAYISQVSNITDRIQARDNLIESEKRFAQLASAATEGIGITVKGEIKDVNDRLLEMTGYSRDELVGEKVLKIVYPEDFDIVMTNISAGNEGPYDHRMITKDGDILYVEVRAFSTTYKGEMARLTTIYDVTKRRRDEAVLKEAFAEVNRLKAQLEQENTYLREEIEATHNYEEMVFRSNEFLNVINQVEQVAVTDATVLIQGETGTGKELIARAVHNVSKRSHKPMVKVNCAAIPKDLIESELFGHERGSFTGALKERIGKFELAHGGTLFLDEIGELPIELQPKLLRALQEGEIEKIGSSKLINVDVRVITATNKDLKKESTEGRFREDLYFRLDVFPIHVPALRERPEDIPILLEHFIDKYSSKHGKSIKFLPEEALDYFKSYDWPGNVRELENTIERSIILAIDNNLPIPNVVTTKTPRSLTHITTNTLDDVLRNHITRVLLESNWKIDGEQGAAKKLALKPSTLRDRMKKLGIKRPS